VKNKLVFLILSIALLMGCLSTQRQLYHLKTGDELKTISLEPMINFTNYDDEPFELERRIRELIHQRYKLKVVSENADIKIKLTLKIYRRGTLRQASVVNTSRSVTAIAELQLFDSDGSELDRSEESKTEIYTDNSPADFKKAQNTLLDRLADELVVDLLEP